MQTKPKRFSDFYGTMSPLRPTEIRCWSDNLMSIALSPQLQSDMTAPEHRGDWRALDCYTQNIYHPLYQCHVYTWLAMGWSKNKHQQRIQQYHLYIEFRAADSSSQYQTRIFNSLDAALAFQQTKVKVMTLTGISPRQTAKRPIKPVTEIAPSNVN